MAHTSHNTPDETTSSPLHIDIRRDGRTTVLRLTGELDMATADVLRHHILLALGQHDPDRLLLDLTGLEFADSSGLAAMVWAHRLLTERGRQLRLYRPQPGVRRVLHVTGLHTRLHITETPPPPRGNGAAYVATTRTAARRAPRGYGRRGRPNQPG